MIRIEWQAEVCGAKAKGTYLLFEEEVKDIPAEKLDDIIDDHVRKLLARTAGIKWTRHED